MHELIFTLQQHTPLIHFQHDQDGATLRATEVKPKLDGFIWGKWKNEEGSIDNAFEKYCQYLVGYTEKTKSVVKTKFDKGYRALDYRMKIVASENKLVYKKEIVSVTKDLVLYEKVTGLVTTLHTLLDKQLKEGWLEEFFIVTNFGNRTSKGYGCFYVIVINDEETELHKQIIAQVLKKNYGYIGFIEVNEAGFDRYNISSLFRVKKNTSNDREKAILKAYNDSVSKLFYNIPDDKKMLSIHELPKQSEYLKFVFAQFVSSKLESLKKKNADLSGDIQSAYENNIQKISDLLLPNAFNTIIDKIEGDCRELKSGVNGNFYLKSELFKVFIRQNIVWEKRLIKKAINHLTEIERGNKQLSFRRPPSINEDVNDNNWNDTFLNTDYRFIRILLGMPEQYEFKVKDVNTGNDVKNYKFVVSFKSISDNIERYQSPLFFKIWNNFIFVSYKEINIGILNQPFEINFMVKQKNGNGWGTINGTERNLISSILSPSEKELDATDFYQEIEGYFNYKGYQQS